MVVTGAVALAVAVGGGGGFSATNSVLVPLLLVIQRLLVAGTGSTGTTLMKA